MHKARLALAELIAVYEARMGQNLEETLVIKSPADAYNFLRAEMEHLGQEQLRVINLNAKNGLISSRMIYQGSVNMAQVRVGEVFRPAIVDNAVCIIVAHNHPSGDPTPSAEDARVTRSLVQAGELLNIDVLDHIVIGKGNFVSLKERGLGFGNSRIEV